MHLAEFTQTTTKIYNMNKHEFFNALDRINVLCRKPNKNDIISYEHMTTTQSYKFESQTDTYVGYSKRGIITLEYVQKFSFCYLKVTIESNNPYGKRR